MKDEFENDPPPETRMQKYIFNSRRLEAFEHERALKILKIKTCKKRTAQFNRLKLRCDFLNRKIRNLRRTIQRYEVSDSF